MTSRAIPSRFVSHFDKSIIVSGHYSGAFVRDVIYPPKGTPSYDLMKLFMIEADNRIRRGKLNALNHEYIQSPPTPARLAEMRDEFAHLIKEGEATNRDLSEYMRKTSKLNFDEYFDALQKYSNSSDISLFTALPLLRDPIKGCKILEVKIHDNIHVDKMDTPNLVIVKITRRQMEGQYITDINSDFLKAIMDMAP